MRGKAATINIIATVFALIGVVVGVVQIAQDNIVIGAVILLVAIINYVMISALADIINIACDNNDALNAMNKKLDNLLPAKKKQSAEAPVAKKHEESHGAEIEFKK